MSSSKSVSIFKTYKNRFSSMSSACFMLAAAITCHSAAAHEVSAAYQLTAIADAGKGQYVINGEYSTAIEKIESQSVKYFSAETNLCVAYTISGDVVAAKEACNRALAIVDQGKKAERSLKFGNHRRSLAVALSNRGVFRALTGDLQGAKVDLSRAVSLGSHLRQAKQNLIRLESKVPAPKTVAAS